MASPLRSSAMYIQGIDHVQLAIPRGSEEEARAFYVGVLGLEEVPKPPRLAARGGAWFASGDLRLHLGIDDDFSPATKAHPALLVNGLAGLIKRCEEGGYPVRKDTELEGYDRVYVSDPFGNRIELMEPTSSSGGS